VTGFEHAKRGKLLQSGSANKGIKYTWHNSKQATGRVAFFETKNKCFFALMLYISDYIIVQRLNTSRWPEDRF